MGYVNHDILKQMSIDVGDEMLGTLITFFVDDTSERIKAFRVQLEQKDYASLGISAHTVKSVCAQYGVMECSARARELEMICRGKEPEAHESEIRTRVEELCRDLAAAVEEIRNITL
jgi:HPt (histidine-containing phosphotransfer) domain-containing protein